MNNYLEELAVQNSNRANELGIENMKLKKRINEAIEYIEKNIGDKNYINSNYTEEYDNYFDVKFEIIDNLLNILKGEEND